MKLVILITIHLITLSLLLFMINQTLSNLILMDWKNI